MGVLTVKEMYAATKIAEVLDLQDDFEREYGTKRGNIAISTTEHAGLNISEHMGGLRVLKTLRNMRMQKLVLRVKRKWFHDDAANNGIFQGACYTSQEMPKNLFAGATKLQFMSWILINNAGRIMKLLRTCDGQNSRIFFLSMGDFCRVIWGGEKSQLLR
ncbi:hypothetical protein SELMODRAFT_418160 [Selaginella moellendorffii]|uniref:Uncharacterized protein n=1 Tax=Selaginella moellendorffii TaxID=88036 RepID=D8S4V4_SELML|nr:hypothetical protein SELMODRAFT_418160 [Selaginella moellendorffii]